MRKYLCILITALGMCSCAKDTLYVQLPGTVWEILVENTTTWLCFHDETTASILQYSSARNLSQTAHGTYTADGHSVVINAGGSEYKVVRTYSNLKHSSTQHNFTKLSPQSFQSLTGSIWAVTENNNLRIGYFYADGKCASITCSNISEKEGDPKQVWSANTLTCTQAGHFVDIADNTAILYKPLLTIGSYAALLNCSPLEEEGTSDLKGSVWYFKEAGEIRYAIIFNGKDSFTRISGAWTGNISTVKINQYVFGAQYGSYSLADGALKMTLDGEEEKSCSLAGSSLTFNDKTYTKLDY